MSIFTQKTEGYGSGRLGRPGALELSDVQKALVDYKAKVAKRYRIAPPEELDRYLPDGRLLISPKIDGELWFAVKRQGEVALCAPNGRVLLGIPVVQELERQLARAPDCILAGELFVASRSPGVRPRVFHVAKALNDPDQAPAIGWKGFDVAQWQGEDALAWPYDRRLTLLREHLPETGRASLSTTVEGDRGEAKRRYSEWVGTEKFEGLVVRAENGFTYKVKPAVTIDAVLVAFGERLAADSTAENPRSEVRELNVAFVRDDGTFHIAGSVGSGLDAAQRTSFHERLTAMLAPCDYRMANREGTLCRFVRPEIVVELKVSDLLPPEPGEPSATRMTLAWDPKEGWKAQAAIPLPALLHPVFVDERPDKTVDAANCGLDQIRQILPLAEEDNDPRLKNVPSARGLPPSRVLARRAWVKVTKDKKAVRKYVAWATDKELADPRYPPFVVCFTDFSPGRKDPLQRELRVASSEERLREHIAAWEAENIKKGWAEAPAPAKA
ncbi:MAG: hypothetical protein U1F43_12075 [Myxococcota bacterium]